MAQFSRLQLVKALIEYDNEYLSPEEPRKLAEESAIFRALRRPPRQPLQQRNTDFLSVALPSDVGPGGGRSMSMRESMLDPSYRRSITSVDNLRNPFGRDSTHEGGDIGDEIEVDLASWGLDAFDDKSKKKSKKLQRQESDAASILPNPHPPLQNSPIRTRPTMSARTMSMGNIPFLNSVSGDDINMGAGGAFLDAASAISQTPALSARRHSIGSPLDFQNMRPSDPALMKHRRRASGHVLIDNIPVAPPLHAVPFPNASEDEAGLAYDAVEEETDTNPFAIRPPSPERASRFDPKSRRSRVVSGASMGTLMLDGESPRPEDSISMISPKPGRDRPYSRLELMRPKLLVMPSPLQGSAPGTPEVPEETRDGFLLSTDGPPLPAAARSGSRGSVMDMLSPPLSTGSSAGKGGYFTPNPRANLTLSQLTFRNTLMVDGQRDVAYTDIDERLRWAQEEGEQAPIADVQSTHMTVPTMEITPADAADADEFEQMKKDRRPAGKLYGRSLIDDLEAKKAAMKGQQRVFTGDQRPSMMARTPLKRSSTFIDPESLKQRPTSTMVRADTTQSLGAAGLARRKTLINFDDEVAGAPRGSAYLGVGNQPGAAGNAKSVFGVDMLWERELEKLRKMEAEEAEAEKRGEEQGEEAGKKKGKKRKGKQKESNAAASLPEPLVSPSPSQEISTSPSGAPAISSRRSHMLRAPPPPVSGEDSEDEDNSDTSSVAGRPAVEAKSAGWHSDEEDAGPRRTTGSGPRYPNLPPRLRALQEQEHYPNQPREDDEDSEEDLPLVATIGRAAQRATTVDPSGIDRRRAGGDSSDEDAPLSQLLDKTKLKISSPPIGVSLLSPSAHPKSQNDGEEDDEPLGLRVSRIIPSANSQAFSVTGGRDEDEDDRPLALHPDQMRKSQFIMAAQQQQQQQMMMQAAAAQMQMQQSMMFGAPSIMSAPFFGPPMAGPTMMIPPQMPGTPPPMHDAAKLNRVDKWRHDVAVEEER